MFSFYSLWEEINNNTFNSMEVQIIKNNEVGCNRFTMTLKRLHDEFNAIEIVVGAGNYSEGTYAHKDIVFEFAS